MRPAHLTTLLLLLLLPLAGCGDPAVRSLQSIAKRDLRLQGEDPEKRLLANRVRLLLRGQRHERLEAILDSLQRHRVCWASGDTQVATAFVMGFGEVDRSDDAEAWAVHLQRLRTWADARPESDLPRLAIAEALLGRAWAARGEGFAHTVSVDEWRRYRIDVEEALQRLRQCRPGVRASVHWHSAMLRAMHSAGADLDSAYRELATVALARFPDESRLYLAVANHLMPRWYGEPGDWQDFATRATAALPDSIADEFYARIVLSQARFVENVFDDGGPVDRDRVLRGLDRWQRRWPGAEAPRSGRAMIAWMAHDRALARQAFAEVGDICNLDVWNALPRYWKARMWAEGTRG